MGAYAGDLKLAVGFFGPATPLARLNAAWLGRFVKSEALLKRANGSHRKPLSVARARRVLRLMLVWAEEQGHIEQIPLPKAELPKRQRSGDTAQ